MSWVDRIFGSSSRVALLRTLAAYAGHPLPVRELARLSNMSPIQASRLIRDLEEFGVVVRQPGRKRPSIRADLSHPVMRDLVLPLLAFEEREINRMSREAGEELLAAQIPCLTILSSLNRDGDHVLTIVVPDDADPREVSARLRGHEPTSVLAPAIEVMHRADAARLSAERVRARWGMSLSRLFEKESSMSQLAPTLHHRFEEGVDDWLLHDPLAQRVRWLGRDALMLGGGRPVLAPAMPEPPYSLRAMASGGADDCYVGVCFHLDDLENFEAIYLAPQAGGKPEAIQYDPVINGSTTWQIFGDADGLAVASLEPKRWFVLRVDVWPEVAQVYLDDEAAPLATFPLRTKLRQGRVGLWGYLPSYVAEFAVDLLHLPAPALPASKVAPPPGTVQEWLVATLDTDSGGFIRIQPAASEHNGVLCLNRLFKAEPETQVYAAFDVELPAGAGTVVLELGYSDRVRCWYDGTPVHTGEWRWDPVAGTDGRVRPGQVSVPLTTVEGRHHVMLEIVPLEPGFGWGATARVIADGRPCATRPASRLQMPEQL